MALEISGKALSLQQSARDNMVNETLQHGGPGTDFDDISIDFVINARGRFCILHNRPFPGTPVWVKYLTNKRKIILILDNGTERMIEYVMDEKFHKHVLNASKAFVIRIDKGKPVEGYDTTLIKE